MRLKLIKGFTLNELLIVIGILAILAGATVLVLNPGELLGQARDSKRIGELNSLASAITFHTNSIVGGYKGEENTVYISLPDTVETCDTLLPSLPAIPAGWSYHCVTTDNLTKTDGDGWLPINFNAMPGGSPFEQLPIDPENSASSNLYYSYVYGGASGGYVVTALLESEKQGEKAYEDGGSDSERFEAGSDFSLWSEIYGIAGYWRFDEGAGSGAADSSGNGNNGAFVGSPIWKSGNDCKTGGCLSFSPGNYINLGNPDELKITGSQTIAMWIKPSAIGDGIRRNPYAKAYGGEGTITQEPAGSLSYYYGTYGGNGSPYQGYGGAASLVAGQWTHVAIVRDLSSMKLYWYKNGALLGSAGNATYASAAASGLDAFIGHGYTTDYLGEIDDVRIFNRALNASEINKIYNATK